jgi:transcriptional regulator with XRE-family HTH domain
MKTVGQRPLTRPPAVGLNNEVGTGGKGAGFALPVASAAPLQPQARQSPGGLDGIGPRLGELRRSLGMTQVDVAFKMGTTQPALARLEKGDSKSNLRTLSRYATALGKQVVVKLDTAVTAPSRKQGTAGDAAAKPGSRVLDIEMLPAALAAMRKERGITQSEVASRMATTQPVIARLESGDGFPNLTTLERFSQAIGATLDVSFETSAEAGDAATKN